MSNIPSDLLYSKDHEWIRVNGTQAILGITDHAQQQLGDIVFVDCPKPGDKFSQSDPIGTIESVKAVAEYYAEVSGTVIEVNEALQGEPELINDDPYGEGWLVKINMSNPKEVDGLMSADEYAQYIDEEGA